MSKINNCPKDIPISTTTGEESNWFDIAKNPNTPFVHKFETERNKYIYDVNTMHIVRVDPTVWDLISDFGDMSKDEIISKYSLHYGIDTILSAYNEIMTAQQRKSLFLPKRPEVDMPLTNETIQKKLDNERMMLVLSITENCNFSCSYCVYSGQYVYRHMPSNKQMNWGIAKKAIDDFLRHSGASEYRSIGFYGGEPLLNLSLIRKCVSYVQKIEKGAKIHFSITTNGSLLRGEAAEFLARENFNIVVSLDGPRQIHDRYRLDKNSLPTWNRITSNVRTLLEKHPKYKAEFKLGYNTTLAPPLDIGELERFFRDYDLFWEGIHLQAGFIDPIGITLSLKGKVAGLEKLYKKFVNNLATGKINNNMSDKMYKLQRSLYEIGWVKFHKRFERYVCPVHEQKCLPEKFCMLSTCIPGARRTFVSTDGDYFICERVPETEYMKIGHVEEGLNTLRVRQLLKDWVNFNKDQCKFCWCLHTCAVGCWSGVCDGAKPTELLKNKACAGHRRRMHKLLVDYCSVLEKNPQALDYMKNIKLL